MADIETQIAEVLLTFFGPKAEVVDATKEIMTRLVKPLERELADAQHHQQRMAEKQRLVNALTGNGGLTLKEILASQGYFNA